MEFTHPGPSSTCQLLRLRSVLDLTGKCRSSLYADIAAGRFVRPIKISTRASAWPLVEVEAVIAALVAGWPEALCAPTEF
jgi:prophage regulatory protein